MMNKERELTARELREAIDIILQALVKANILTPSDIVRVPRLLKTYDYYIKHDIPIPERAFIRDGVTDVGDPIVYQAVLETKPVANMRPDKIKTSFTELSTGTTGYPLWVRPAWELDAYQPNEIVEHKEIVYTNYVKDNMKEPGAANSGWYKEGERPPENPIKE
jgi:hypothetical protein